MTRRPGAPRSGRERKVALRQRADEAGAAVRDRPELVEILYAGHGHRHSPGTQRRDATLAEISEALKRGQPVSLRDVRSFYVRLGRDRWVVTFNPSPRRRRVFS